MAQQEQPDLDATTVAHAILHVASIAAARLRNAALASPVDDASADRLLRTVVAAARDHARTFVTRSNPVVAVPMVRAVEETFARSRTVAASIGDEEKMLRENLDAHDLPGATDALVEALVFDPPPTAESLEEAEGKPNIDAFPKSGGPKDDAREVVAKVFGVSKKTIYNWVAADVRRGGASRIRTVPLAYDLHLGSVATIRYVLGILGIEGELASNAINESLRALKRASGA